MTSSAVPTTATVLDFICLFTHDLKRKQKRWQDGVLKYHTFNKRVMVSDDRGHFIGDAHWQGGDLEPGDEFELDRGAAIVQVSDCTGQHEQDLTELLEKRAKDVEKRRTNAGIRATGPTAPITHTPRNDSVAHTPRNDHNAPHFQLRHRPLTDLVGGTSRTGRAVISPHSPYEARKMALSPGQQQDSPSEDARPLKRRRREESPPSKLGHARALFGTTLTLTPFSSSMPMGRSQALQDTTSMAPKNTSMDAGAGSSGAQDRAGRRTKSPSPDPNPEKARTNAPRETAPRRVLTQRASLRELLAGNEHNRNGEVPRPKETTSRTRTASAKPIVSHAEENVISLLSQEPGSTEHHRDATLNNPRTAQPKQKAGERQPSKPRSLPHKTTEVSDLNQDRSKSPDLNDEAFLNWLGQSEDISSNRKSSVPPSRPRPSRSKTPAQETMLIQKTTKVAQEARQEPDHVDEDDEARRPTKPARTRPKNVSMSSKNDHVDTTSEPRGTKRTLSTDTAAATHADPDNPPPAKEPRTELRIRSRQRRGLLMIAQKKQGGLSTGTSTPSSSGAGSEVHAIPRVETNPGSASEEPEPVHNRVTEKAMPRKADERRNSTPNESRISILDSDVSQISNTDADTTRESIRRDPQPLKLIEDEAVQHEDVAPVNNLSEDDTSLSHQRRTNPSRRSRPKPAPVVLSAEEMEFNETDSPSRSDDAEPCRKPEPEPSFGPRITKMSRKSVKSKEIIGFVMPVDDFPTRAFVSGSSRQAQIDKPDHVDTAAAGLHQVRTADATRQSRETKPVAQQHEAAQHAVSEDNLQDKQPPRITNPATRGKKAARRQDAAGLPPQAMVQLEPTALSRSAPARPSKQAPSKNDVAQSSLPRFCRANGGAWSRHAEDLLGMTRPTKETTRR
ncbi:hypothetical protein F66182_10363 [Fusarium sp. NRRL 66182]|nr:hypothetical protein F66182_10363 [Fusarium sp. NRRL 66182]